VRNTLNVKHRTTEEPLPLFFIDLEPNENNKDIYDIKFLRNMKITLKAPRQKNTLFSSQDVNLVGTQKHRPTVQSHLHALNAEETVTQPHVQNHQVDQPSVHRVVETTPQATKDVKCTII
jgi:hypothetical protein